MEATRSAAQLVAGTRGYSRLRIAGEMGSLAVGALRVAVTPPFAWTRDGVIEAGLVIRRCLVPLLLSIVPFSIGYGVLYFGGILEALGATERQGGAYHVSVVREIGVWVTTMIFAGIAGSAVTADLGARKIREELDALSVLGVDRLRALILPRLAAMTLMLPVLGLIAVMASALLLYAVAPALLGFQPAVYRHSIEQSVIPLDLIAFVLKLSIAGFFVGIVSCQKGLGVTRGAEGVGRAVNETVVVCFIGIWLINILFNLAFLTLFPQTTVLLG